MSTIDIHQVWGRIHRWLDANAPEMLRQLRPPASPDAIQRAEKILGVEFTPDYRASLAIHDGQGGIGLLVGWRLQRLIDVVETWQMLSRHAADVDSGFSTDEDESIQVVDALRPCWWTTKRIPIAEDGAANFITADYDPAPVGTVGQLVPCWRDVESRKLVASSFGSWLSDFADELDRNMVDVRRDDAGYFVSLRPRDEPIDD
jgi:cell wall assembly regulator SMI1